MVSDMGRVKSVDRVQITRYGVHRKLKGRIMSPTDNGYGYKIVSLGGREHRKNYYVHRLVAEAFIPNPKEKRVVNHKDYNRANNRADNLEWCTDKENIQYSAEHIAHPRTVETGKYGKAIRLKGGRYEVGVYHNRKQHYLGRYDTLEEAKKVRDNWYEKEGLSKWLNQ